jgi:ABC-2 type transport system permease protein
MKQLKRAAVWYVMLNKRFLKKYIFTLLLFMVPLMVMGMRLVSGGEASVLRVALYQEGSERDAEDDIVSRLLSRDGIVRYEKMNEKKEACEAVERGTADCAWIFPEHIEEAVKEYIAGKGTGIVTVYTKEDTIQNKLAREQLYGVIYPLVSYQTTLQFVEKQEEFSGMGKKAIDSAVRMAYEKNRVEGSIFQFAYMDGTIHEKEEKNSYLTAPLRGMLAVLILLGGMAVTMFYLQDDKEGLFVWMPVKCRRLFPMLYILTGTLNTALAAYAALWFSGTFTTWRRELVLMLIYLLAVVGFCNFLRALSGNIWYMGAGIPVLILVTLVLCPVFINIPGFPVIQYMLPAYYYLNGLFNPSMVWKMLLYALVFCTGSMAISRPFIKS